MMKCEVRQTCVQVPALLLASSMNWVNMLNYQESASLIVNSYPTGMLHLLAMKLNVVDKSIDILKKYL